MEQKLKWFRDVSEKTWRTARQAAISELRKHPLLCDDLDDVLQEAYLRLFKSYNKIRDYDNLDGWIATTIRNVVRGYAKKLYRENNMIEFRLDDDSLNPPPLVSNEPTPESEVLQKEQSAELRQALLEGIGEDAFKLLEAYYIKKIPLETLAANHGTTPAALKMKFYRWKKKLRQNRKNNC